MNIRYSLLASAVAIAVLASSVNAQTSKLYLHNGQDLAVTTTVIQGGSIVNTFGGNARSAWALAVGSTIHTLGCCSGVSGQEFSLTGTPIGSPYLRTPANNNFYDGTTDGTYNYTMGAGGANAVYRANLDWSNPSLLFTAINQGIGITYDAGDNALWIANFGLQNLVREYSLAGVYLNRSFVATAVSTQIGMVAYDGADQTLWLSDYTTNGMLYQYDRAGHQLASVNTGSQQWLGGEFQETASAAPEPASVVLTGTGLLGMIGIARRKRRR